jgi:hypothetical protein
MKGKVKMPIYSGGFYNLLFFKEETALFVPSIGNIGNTGETKL